MNWYKKASKIYNDDDMMEYMNVLLQEEIEGSDLTPYERIEVKERLDNIINSFPPGYTIRKSTNGWTVFSPEGHAVSVDEKELMYSLPGGKARFDFMGQSV